MPDVAGPGLAGHGGPGPAERTSEGGRHLADRVRLARSDVVRAKAAGRAVGHGQFGHGRDIRRRDVGDVHEVAELLVLAYLPHLVSVGASVLGYLPGYLREEGYGSGFRFALLTWLVPDAWAIALAAGIIAVVAVAVTRLGSPDEPWHGSALMVGTVLIVTSPAYPWYALLLVGLVALGARPEWLAVAAAGYLAQYAAEVGLASGTARQLGYGGAVLLLLVSRRVTDRLRRPATPPGGAHPPVPWMDGSARAGRRR